MVSEKNSNCIKIKIIYEQRPTDYRFIIVAYLEQLLCS